MSNAYGTVTFPDGLVMYYEYIGTVDTARSCLYDTLDELYDNWRKMDWKNCNCGKDEPVKLFSSYGGGSDWNGRACRTCRAITEGREPSYFTED